jgi:hypothetical protein
MKAEDVRYEQTTEVDGAFYIKTLGEFMDIAQVSDTTKVCLTVILRSAMDDAYKQGMDAGYY